MKVKSSLSYKITYYFFHLICTSATIFFVSFCLYKYSLNKDLSQVTFQEFHKTKENIYPSMTLCFANIFYEENLKEYGIQSIDDYTNYLNGEFWSDSMVDVDYDNVTINISDYLLGFASWTPDWTYIHGDEYFIYDHRKYINAIKDGSTSTYNWKPKFYTSYTGNSQKCMTVDIPFTQGKKIWTFGAVFDSTIFPNSTRPSYYEFGIKMHYPGQLLRHQMQKYVWKSLENKTSAYVTMRFKVQKLEVIRNRETSNKPCNKNWKEDDKTMLLQKISRIGCKPSFLKINSNSPICKSQNHMKMFATFNSSHYRPPCQSIQKILYAYEEYGILEDWTDEWTSEIDDIFEVMFEFTDGTYMEIEQVRDYGVQDVVGDIGGYLGLFLGFALLQIPEMIFTIISWIYSLVRQNDITVQPEKHFIPQIGNCSGLKYCQCKKETEKIKLELGEIKLKLLQIPMDLDEIKT